MTLLKSEIRRECLPLLDWKFSFAENPHLSRKTKPRKVQFDIMKVSTSYSVLLLLAAMTVTAQFLNQSSLFSLVLFSDNCTSNSSVIVPCHEGAAIEGLCVANDVPATPSTAYFQFNTTDDDVNTDPSSSDTSGILTYLLRGGNFNLSSPMEIEESIISNVAMALFTPGEGTEVAFDADGKMNIQGFDDETGKVVAYYRWYVCETDYTGYKYETLVWLIGGGQPDNPTCEKVDVVRVFP